MKKEFLKLGRGKKWKIVETFNPYDKVLKVEKKEFSNYKVLNDGRLESFINLDNLLDYARYFRYTQVEIIYED
jgi:hypothetical protein